MTRKFNRGIKLDKCLLLASVLVLAIELRSELGMARNPWPLAQTNAGDSLRKMGAKQLDASGREFEIEQGVLLSLGFGGDELATVRVRLTSDYSAPKPKEGQPPAEEPGCCMSQSEYTRQLAIIDKVKQIGTPILRDNVGVIPTSGWVRRSEEYSRARVVYVEHYCSNPGRMLGCGVARFTVFYWLPLSGVITRKRVAVSHFLGGTVTSYFVSVSGTEVEVSKGDYRRLRKGQRVRLEHTLDNSFARVLDVVRH